MGGGAGEGEDDPRRAGDRALSPGERPREPPRVEPEDRQGDEDEHEDGRKDEVRRKKKEQG